MTTDTSYTIKTKDNASIVSEYNTGNPNIWTVGSTISFEFHLPRFENDLTVSSSYTVSDLENYDVVTVENGATLTINSGATLQANQLVNNGTVDNNGSLIVNSDTFGAIIDYHKHAGSFATVELQNNKINYKSQLPSSANISSLLWGIEPADSLQSSNIEGVWGLLESLDNNRNPQLTTDIFSAEILVLATFSEYASVSDVETDLQI